jgi:hypothetical protein
VEVAEEVGVGGGHPTRILAAAAGGLAPHVQRYLVGEAGTPVTVVSLPARGRSPQAVVRRAGLEVEEKLLTSSIHAANTAAWARSSAQGIVAP